MKLVRLFDSESAFRAQLAELNKNRCWLTKTDKNSYYKGDSTKIRYATGFIPMDQQVMTVSVPSQAKKHSDSLVSNMVQVYDSKVTISKNNLTYTATLQDVADVAWLYHDKDRQVTGKYRFANTFQGNHTFLLKDCKIGIASPSFDHLPTAQEVMAKLPEGTDQPTFLFSAESYSVSLNEGRGFYDFDYVVYTRTIPILTMYYDAHANQFDPDIAYTNTIYVNLTRRFAFCKVKDGVQVVINELDLSECVDNSDAIPPTENFVGLDPVKNYYGWTENLIEQCDENYQGFRYDLSANEGKHSVMYLLQPTFVSKGHRLVGHEIVNHGESATKLQDLMQSPDLTISYKDYQETAQDNPNIIYTPQTYTLYDPTGGGQQLSLESVQQSMVCWVKLGAERFATHTFIDGDGAVIYQKRISVKEHAIQDALGIYEQMFDEAKEEFVAKGHTFEQFVSTDGTTFSSNILYAMQNNQFKLSQVKDTEWTTRT